MDRHIRQAIQTELATVAGNHGLDVIAGREFGSHARDLAHSESDHDIHAITLDNPSSYLTDRAVDTIEITVRTDETNEIEFHTWDLMKYAEGLIDSNPTALESAASPEQVYVDETVAEPLSVMEREALQCFKPFDLIQHYRSMAESNYTKYLFGSESGTDKSTKRMINVAQAFLRARYVEEHHEFPPMNYDELLGFAVHEPAFDGYRFTLERIGEMKRDGIDRQLHDGEQIHDELMDLFGDELDRDVGYEGHVDRQPDTRTIRNQAERVAERVWS